MLFFAVNFVVSNALTKTGNNYKTTNKSSEFDFDLYENKMNKRMLGSLLWVLRKNKKFIRKCAKKKKGMENKKRLLLFYWKLRCYI